MKKMSPAELYEQETKKAQLKETIPKPHKIKKTTKDAPLPEETEMSIDQKILVLAKGWIYGIYVMTILFAACLILIAVLYPYPVNVIILGIAIISDILALALGRKYMAK